MLGSIWIASHVSWWIIVCVVIASTTGTTYIIRKITEGRLYDVAYSSMPGDLSLALYCGMIAGICQKAIPEGLHTALLFHEITFAASMFAGIIIHILGLSLEKSRDWNLMPAQWYHNLLVIPIFSYAITSTLPILWHAGDIPLAASAIGCLLLWLFLFICDLTQGNLMPWAHGWKPLNGE